MNIKSLHLRNIASIETADIDFTKDLADGVTGDPASVFLICGDTGAGKSIVLDAISMALYKTTPRLSSTSNKTNNTFSDSAESGEKISINSIDQYTRLGISAKDPSYSELIFEGNDGKEYTARLSLGMYLSNTDKATGKRHLKHNKPSWTLSCDGITLTRDSDISAAIGQAVGLSFEQFGRMAMLAQGQFASFLTGDKKERESILEQLTNTAHFTEFGRAIKSLYDKAASSHKMALSELRTEETHSIPEQQLARLHEERAAAEAAGKELDVKIKAHQEVIDHVKLIEADSKTLAAAREEKARIEERISGEDYKDKVTLTDDWKATAEPRCLLCEMRKALQAKALAAADEDKLCRSFTALAADLCFRREEAAGQAEEIAREQLWLDERKERDALYAEAAAVALQIDALIHTHRELADNKKLSLQEQGRSEPLQQALTRAQEEAQECARRAEAKQQEINELTSQRQQLQPEQTNRLLQEANDRGRLLTRMAADVKYIESASRKSAALERQVAEGQEHIRTLREEAQRRLQLHESAAKAYDASLSALSTMEMSLDKKIVALRVKLANEHAQTCPLCGQHITKISVDEDFKELLQPLHRAQEEAKAVRDAAKKELDEANRALNSAEGELNAHRKALQETLADIRKREAALQADASAAALDISREPASAIDAAAAALQSRMNLLKTRQQQAVVLQNGIDRLLEEKKPLDKAKAAADRQENAATKALDNHRDCLARLAETAATLEASRQKLTAELSAKLDAPYPCWKDDAAVAGRSLQEDAGEYNRRKERLASAVTRHEVKLKEIENIEGLCGAVCRRHAAWDASPEALPAQVPNLLASWQTLVSDVENLAAKMENFDATANDCAASLQAYYEASGKSESHLDAIQSRAGEIEQAQEMLNQTRARLQSRTDAIATALERIAEAKGALGIERDEDIPPLQALEDEKAALALRKEDVVKTISSIDSQLATDSDNKVKVELCKKKLKDARDVFDKWDKLNELFGGTRLRTRVQTHILRPLLNNANIYLERITDRYVLTCSTDNEQLSILVRDRYNKNRVRSATLLSGGERFMISLALSLALSSLNRPDMNVNILFIDEGFGTLDEKSLESVMHTLERLQEIAGESRRRVGIISHREELNERIPVQVRVLKKGEGRSIVQIKNQ